MTDAQQTQIARERSRSRLGALAAPRESAFPEALRHTARVTRLRRWMLWGAGGVVALVGLGLLIGSLSFLPVDLNLARVALKGTRIVIETPKLVGYRKDGRPYEVRARVGVQDIAKPDIFELEGLDVRVENTQDNSIVLTAEKGVYSTKSDYADLSGGVTIRDDKNFDMRLDSASMDFKSSVMKSDKPVTLRIDGGEVVAKSVEFVQKERRATFVGDVHSVLYGEGDVPPDGLRPAQ
ncbi:LPS export ABC transporter periplasmic protein LptC [Methylocystis sp. WRRC1]|uniref:LPS export ABC transporter periplasmic protein LptC n=1 Tax=unclassified Methylocystis TaxID=2625913 RepID=UPI0001F86CB4|nr:MULTISPECIES: LPS export ABC transporter periplasmic protein LptC [unclassified Methylocystis]MCC3244976.1 LPS export ABC transporter periplasmic protein LptC [Methylocystis sp. WRRC1]